jgi:hypothetical protein
MDMSEWYAFDALDDAINRTKALLWPIKLGVWLRIAIIAFFVGGYGGVNVPVQYTTGELPPEVGSVMVQHLPLIFGVIALIAAVAIILGVVGSVIQFVFVDCLSQAEISLTKHIRPRLGKGLRLFGFMVGVTLLFITLLLIPVILFLIPALSAGGDIGPQIVLPFVLLYLFYLILIAIPFGLLIMFTVDFVVPIMIRDDCGVIEGWKRCFAMLKKGWKQAAIYALVKIVLGIATAIIIFIIAFIVLLVVAVPFILLGIALVSIYSFWVGLLIVGIPFVIIMILIMLFIQVPFVTFFRYYSLRVLGDFSPEYALLPEIGQSP